MTTAVRPDVVANDNISFDYAYVPVGDLKVETSVDKLSGKTRISGWCWKSGLQTWPFPFCRCW